MQGQRVRGAVYNEQVLLQTAGVQQMGMDGAHSVQSRSMARLAGEGLKYPSSIEKSGKGRENRESLEYEGRDGGDEWEAGVAADEQKRVAGAGTMRRVRCRRRERWRWWRRGGL
jgi:hypothetical protein